MTVCRNVRLALATLDLGAVPVSVTHSPLDDFASPVCVRATGGAWREGAPLKP
jgi:hypothetical protein